MSNSKAAFLYAYPAGYTTVFTDAELAPLAKPASQAQIWAYEAEYKIRSEKLTKDLNIPVKGYKTRKATMPDGSVVQILNLSDLEAVYCADGKFPASAQESAICDGMLSRTVKALNAYVYRAEKEIFDEYKGAIEARKFGKKFVICENLS